MEQFATAAASTLHFLSTGYQHPREDLARSLEEVVFQHSAIHELKGFGESLQQRPLTKPELKLFFASLVAFAGDIPGGIVGLSLRMTDEWFKIDPLNATSIGAAILFAAVDEYGLHDMARGPQATHHQMLLNTIRHWDLTAADMLDPDYILPEGRIFGRITYEYYRNQSVAAALGFHFASEATSSLEFEAYLEGFAKFESAYKLRDRDDPALAFFVIHTEVESAHRDMGYRMIQLYCDQNPGSSAAVIAGARAFLDAYGALFAALNTRIFGQSATNHWISGSGKDTELGRCA